jgi:LPS sulfotransferase NodH
MGQDNSVLYKNTSATVSPRAGLLRAKLIEAGVTKSVILASTFRSGSTYVAETMRENGISGLSLEKFNLIWKAAADDGLREAAFDAIATTANNGLFATKIMWPHRNHLAACLGLDRAQSDLLAGSFPCAKWLWVKRQDKIRQAISFWRARSTSLWWVRDGRPNPAIAYDFEAIRDAYREIIIHDICWADFFACTGIEPYAIDYEAFMDDPGEHVRQMFDFLGMSLAGQVVTRVTLRQMRDGLTEELYDRFMQDCYRHG